MIPLDPEAGEMSIAHLEILPDGDTLLFTLNDRFNNAHIVAQSVETGERRVLLDGGSNPRYLPTGHLLYFREDTLLAVPFDPERLEVRGNAVPLVEDVSGGHLRAGSACPGRAADRSCMSVGAGPCASSVWSGLIGAARNPR